MISQLKTYRLLKIITVCMLAVSFALPTIAAGAAFCDMDMTQMESMAHAGDHCDLDHAESADHNSENEFSANTGMDCAWTDCSLSIEELSRNDAVLPAPLKAEISIPSTIAEYISVDTEAGIQPVEDPETSFDDSLPPIFLLNSTFLN